MTGFSESAIRNPGNVFFVWYEFKVAVVEGQMETIQIVGKAGKLILLYVKIGRGNVCVHFHD